MTVAPAESPEQVPPPPVPLLAAPWRARPCRADGADLDLVHGWMQSAHIEAFWHQAWSRERWHEEIAGHLSGKAITPLIVEQDEEPLAYVEVYRVIRDELAGHYPHEPHDLGLHIAIGEVARTGRGLGRVLLRALADGLLAADPACRRVVAEPDVGNSLSIRAFEAAGYLPSAELRLAHKTARLLVRPRTPEDMPG